MRRRDVATAAPRSVGLYRVRMAEGVKSTPSDALPLSLFPSPSFTVTLNCFHVNFSRDYRYIFLLPKPTPFFLFVSSKGIFGDIRYRLFFFSFFSSRGYTGLSPHYPFSFFRPFSLALLYYRHIGWFSIPLVRVCIYTFVSLTRSKFQPSRVIACASA